jgi:hypothetical protein
MIDNGGATHGTKEPMSGAGIWLWVGGFLLLFGAVVYVASHGQGGLPRWVEAGAGAGFLLCVVVYPVSRWLTAHPLADDTSDTFTAATTDGWGDAAVGPNWTSSAVASDYAVAAGPVAE